MVGDFPLQHHPTTNACASTEPVYRLAEKEWKDFIDAFTPLLVEVDPQIPHLPPKDVIHRIYRDVRVPLPYVLRGDGDAILRE